MTGFLILIIFLGFLPSLIWLLFYLRKDVHPEPKEMVIKIFLLGMLSAFVGAVLSLFFSGLIKNFQLSFYLTLFLQIFISVALIEEIIKYLPVHFYVLNNPEFDEPIDAMIYMIISGLGFAAVENILFLSSTFFISQRIEATIFTLLGRFISATLLHALASANIGYFLALSFLKFKRKILFFSIGVLTSALLHGIYNFAIKINEIQKLTLGGGRIILISGGVIIFLIFLVWWEFEKIKKLKSVCKL